MTLIGGPDVELDDAQVARFVSGSLDGLDLDGRSVCLVIPDATRSCPLPQLMREIHTALVDRVGSMTALVALGTHAAMTDEQLEAHVGAPYPGLVVENHAWWDPDTFTSLGTIAAGRVRELSDGRLDQAVEVRINRRVVESDVVIVVGPVFPHEVVGFSGGNKYFFPGVAGPEVIDLSHWLGALISSVEIIGAAGTTPVRALIDAAAAMIPSERHALCLVVTSGAGTLRALSFGAPEEAWAECADISAQTHIRYLDRPVRRVVSLIPEKYDDMWTAAKGFYKVEPVVAEAGEVIIYAPHITQISAMHPEINDIGYHCRDYFTAQWDRFSHLHWGVLAHSTHLRGAGTYDTVRGEQLRVTVTLATGIPEDVVRAANLSYLDPAQVDVVELGADPETLVVPEAGEVLFRLHRAE